MSDRHRLIVDDFGMAPPVRAALIWAESIASPVPTEETPPFVARIVAAARAAGEEAVPEGRRRRVRDMLRHGRYKPTGRGKPASEYLLRAALEDAFPLVNPPVDVNNAVSLASGLPGSIFDADKTGGDLLLRWGRAGESYVFNPAGQAIDLEDLLVVCRRADGGWEPIGNPVKDAMATKIGSRTQHVVAVLYAPIDEPSASIDRWAAEYAELLRTECAARAVGRRLVGGPPPDGGIRA